MQLLGLSFDIGPLSFYQAFLSELKSHWQLQSDLASSRFYVLRPTALLALCFMAGPWNGFNPKRRWRFWTFAVVSGELSRCLNILNFEPSIFIWKKGLKPCQPCEANGRPGSFGSSCKEELLLLYFEIFCLGCLGSLPHTYFERLR